MDIVRGPYELLHRWGEDGTLRGVHYQEAERYFDGEAWRHLREHPPQAIPAEEAHALLGECHGDLLALATSQAEDITRRDAQLDQAERALAVEMVTVSALQDALAAMTAERDALRQRLADLLPQPLV